MTLSFQGKNKTIFFKFLKMSKSFYITEKGSHKPTEITAFSSTFDCFACQFTNSQTGTNAAFPVLQSNLEVLQFILSSQLGFGALENSISETSCSFHCELSPEANSLKATSGNSSGLWGSAWLSLSVQAPVHRARGILLRLASS